MATTTTTKKPVASAKRIGDEEMVTITLPIIRGDNSPVFVQFNDRKYYIKRGVPVSVPLGVQEILDSSDEAYMIAESFKEGKLN